MTTPNNTLQQQQAAQAAQAMQQAQKAAKPKSTASVKFAEVLKGQQGRTSTSKLLKNNPVGGQEVVKTALKNNTGGGSKSKLSAAVNANTGASSSGASSGSTGTSASAASGTSADTASSSMMSQMQGFQDMNMQYLSLQTQMQSESQRFTALSNVSKTRSDTAKNSLSNVK